MNSEIERIVRSLKDYFLKTRFKKAVLGLSGGVDSALVAKLAVMGLGKESVTALLMPNEAISSKESVRDAEAWAKALGITYHIIPLGKTLDTFKARVPWDESEQAAINIQSRLRAVILYHYANTHNALVLGTGNKTEETLGYFTKYGDGAVDILPIGNLYKTQVWEMAKLLDLPKEIIEKTPSAELKAGHTDEDEIGMSYKEIDTILKRFEAGHAAENETEKELWKRIKQNEHKGKMPPVI